MSLESSLASLYQELDGLYQLETSMALLGWDQQVMMPPAGASGRARQLEFLSALHHERLSSDRLWNLTNEIDQKQSQLGADDLVVIRELKRNLARSRKLPTSFVAERSRIAAESFSVWSEAKPKNDWKVVTPHLKKLVRFAREEAQLVGFDEHPYDALLELFEPYSTLASTKSLLLQVGERIRKVLPVLQEKLGAPVPVQVKFSVEKQEKLCRRVLTDLGFEFSGGRLDPSAHPFMTTISARDMRITTRFNENSIFPALFGTIHETGHAFYERGLPDKFRGTPRGSAVSTGIHESQARLWENMVGRSKSFSCYLSDTIKELFGDSVPSEQLWANANKIYASPIRVEADEVTYTLHVVIRMLLEERLLAGELEVDSLEEAWDSLYEHYLGLRPTSVSQGVMQDVHWFGGSFGYFPSYALGNLHGAMFIEQFEREQGSLGAIIENRSFSLLKDWLGEKIYSLGQTYCAKDLVRNVTGKDLSGDQFLAYLSKKFDTPI